MPECPYLSLASADSPEVEGEVVWLKHGSPSDAANAARDDRAVSQAGGALCRSVIGSEVVPPALQSQYVPGGGRGDPAAGGAGWSPGTARSHTDARTGRWVAPY